MSKINDIMTNWLGANWKTTVNGVSSELLGLGATVGMLTAIFGTDQHKAIGAIVVVVAAALKAIARTLAWLAAADAVVDTALDPKGDQKAGYSMPMTTGAIALVCMAAAGWILLTCTGCVTTGLQAVQGVTDRAAAAYGQTDTLQTVREGLAEVEAQKTGRVLLPRNAKAIPGVYVDDLGTILTNGVTLSQWYVVQQRIADRVSAPPSPAGTLPMPAPAPPATAVAPAGDNLLNGPVTGTVTP